MRKGISNINYFIREAKTLFKVDLLSNILSILSIGLIFFILGLVISGWEVSNYIINIVEKEAEVNVYFRAGLGDLEVNYLIRDLEQLGGVGGVSLVREEEALERMADILGKEASILQLFDENPFTSFIEVQVDIEEVDLVLQAMEGMEKIDYIRDNKEIIDRLQNIVIILKVLGILAMVAVGASTLIVVSHIIRQGIYNNREQINTLELLGAPEYFIGLPFLLEGVFLTLLGGILASILLVIILNLGYGQLDMALPFIPLPLKEGIIIKMLILLLSMSGGLGIFGSIFGLSKN